MYQWTEYRMWEKEESQTWQQSFYLSGWKNEISISWDGEDYRKAGGGRGQTKNAAGPCKFGCLLDMSGSAL